MTNKVPAEPQMTDVFGRFQNTIPPLSEPSGPVVNNRKKAMLSMAAVLLGAGAAFAAINFDRIRDYVEGDEELAGDKVPEAAENGSVVETATPVRHHKASAVQNGTITPNESIAIAGQVREPMPFGEAYAAAREEVGPGGIFSWHGQVYNTYTVKEWQGLSLEQRREFLSDVGYRPTGSAEVLENESLTTVPSEDGAVEPPLIIDIEANEVDGIFESELVENFPVENEPIVEAEIAEPAFFDLVINGRQALGIDDDHDGVANAIVFLDENSSSILAFVNAQGDAMIDTVIQFDATSQQVIGQQTIEVPFMAEIDKLENWGDVMDEPIGDIALVADTEEPLAYDDDNDYTHEDGYVNDAELPEMD
ncbi:hypothetical protein [Salmonirosea aquatica]|uniref:Uncharacterized protein n=1 Tax=Salmonirosea aquatica TaxID=2654236 RepID=A0A7C9BA13_9BACT|nr:hypothetical protein [Cytophagaceae bacterium SJW1-29]